MYSYNFRNQLLMKIEWIQLESVQKKLLMRLLKPQIWSLMIQLNVIISFQNCVFSLVCVLKAKFLYLFNAVFCHKISIILCYNVFYHGLYGMQSKQ